MPIDPKLQKIIDIINASEDYEVKYVFKYITGTVDSSVFDTYEEIEELITPGNDDDYFCKKVICPILVEKDKEN